MSKVYLSTIAVSIPENRKKSSEYYMKKVGIETLPYTLVHPYKYMHEAVKKLNIDDFGIIDYCIVCTENFETPIPPLSFKIHNDFKLRYDCGCIDINHGCSGFLYSIETAKSLIQTNEDIHNVLVVCGDAYSKISKDSHTSNIFGDGASAVILTDDKSKGIGEIGKFSKFSKYSDAIKQEYGRPLEMNGHDLIDLVLNFLPMNFKDCLNKNNLNEIDIKTVIPHQSNPHIIKAIESLCVKNHEVSNCFFISDMKDTGNLVQSSIPYILNKHMESFQKDDNILLIGYGVGFSIISTVIKWR